MQLKSMHCSHCKKKIVNLGQSVVGGAVQDNMHILQLQGTCIFHKYSTERLGDILSQRQIVPTEFFGRKIVPDDKMSHFLPMRQIVPATKCPISSPATKCPTDAVIKNYCFTGIFRATNCPKTT